MTTYWCTRCTKQISVDAAFDADGHPFHSVCFVAAYGAYAIPAPAGGNEASSAGAAAKRNESPAVTPPKVGPPVATHSIVLGSQPVRIVGIEISFGQWFGLLLMAGLAAIPAGLILGVFYGLLWVFWSAFTGNY